MILNSDTTKKLYIPFEKFQNELYDYFYENENLQVSVIEEMLIRIFGEKLTKKDLADFLGCSIRTITNKKKEHGSI